MGGASSGKSSIVSSAVCADIFAFGSRQIAIELLHSQVAQRLMPEHVLLSVVQKVVRIRVLRMSFHVARVARISVRLLPDEARWYEHAGASTPDNMKP